MKPKYAEPISDVSDWPEDEVTLIDIKPYARAQRVMSFECTSPEPILKSFMDYCAAEAANPTGWVIKVSPKLAAYVPAASWSMGLDEGDLWQLRVGGPNGVLCHVVGDAPGFSWFVECRRVDPGYGTEKAGV